MKAGVATIVMTTFMVNGWRRRGRLLKGKQIAEWRSSSQVKRRNWLATGHDYTIFFRVVPTAGHYHVTLCIEVDYTVQMVLCVDFASSLCVLRYV